MSAAEHTPGHMPEDCPIEQCPECAAVFGAREARKKKLPMGDPTPGPWQHVVNGRSYDVRTVTAGLGEPIAGRIMRAPDARLIAAAPDLLEEMEKQAHSLAVLKLQAFKDPDVRKLLEEMHTGARAAIAKARGGK